MSRTKFMFFILACACVSSCSIFKPFIDRRRNAGVSDPKLVYTGTSAPSAPAICYNGLWTEFSELQKLADAECKKNKTGSRAIFDHETKFQCKLFLPSRAYFKCEK